MPESLCVGSLFLFKNDQALPDPRFVLRLGPDSGFFGLGRFCCYLLHFRQPSAVFAAIYYTFVSPRPLLLLFTTLSSALGRSCCYLLHFRQPSAVFAAIYYTFV